MTDAASNSTRLLFVIDHDFGALGVVMYMLHRQPLAARALILLPRRAYELHGRGLGVACRSYESLGDILAAVEAHAPHVVCLYSGYLLAAQRLLSVGELGELVHTLGVRGCRLATSDPYIGTFRRLPEADLPAPRGALRHFGPLAKLLQKTAMRRHVRRVEEILEGATHIYPVEVDLPGAGSTPRATFFNPLYIRSEGELRANNAAVSALSPGRTDAPRWLFVIAQFDLEFQEARYGAQRFGDMVAQRMREALEQGRHPTFVGPAAITQALSRRFAGEPGVTILATCSFDEFERRLLDAQAAFYWQVFSTSGFLRLWNGLPVFFFDLGHNSRLLAPMHTNGLESHFMGNPPIQLEIDKPFDVAGLGTHEDHFRKAARDSRERLARLPRPEEMFATIVAKR